MSNARRHDLADRGNATDEAQAFKKPSQTVDRPPVTERDFHEEYMKDPPKNQPLAFEVTTDRRSRGLKEGAQEELDPKQEGVLGDAGVGKQLKQDALEKLTTENSVHPGNPTV